MHSARASFLAGKLTACARYISAVQKFKEIANAHDKHERRRSRSPKSCSALSAPHGEDERRTKDSGNSQTSFFRIKRRSLEENFTLLAGQHSKPLSLQFRAYSVSWSKRIEQESRNRVFLVSAERSRQLCLPGLQPRSFETSELRASRSRSLAPRTRTNYDHPSHRGNVRPPLNHSP